MKTLSLLPFILAFQTVSAQTGSHLKLSSEFPQPREKVTITYDPAGTILDGKKDITAVVYYLDGKEYPAADIDLKKAGGILTGEISIPSAAKAFFFKIAVVDTWDYSKSTTDNNFDKGYAFLIYKNRQPVAGAYAEEARFLTNGISGYLADIKTDNKGAIELYKKEFALYPQSEKEYGNEYYSIAVKNPENNGMILQKITDLEKSTNEKDLIAAASLLSSLNNKKSADSLNTIIKTKFPNGQLVKDDLLSNAEQAKDLLKKDSLYQVFVKMYPDTTGGAFSVLDYLRYQLATAYSQKYDMENAQKFEELIKSKRYAGDYLNATARKWALAGKHLEEAEKLSKRSVGLITELLKTTKGSMFTAPKQESEYYRDTYYADLDTYAFILYKENKYADAYKYQHEIIANDKYVDAYGFEHFVLMSNAVGNYAETKEVAENSIKKNETTDTIKAELKKAYVKLNGSDTGFAPYLALLENIGKNKARADLAKTMINQQAPAFALKDFNGNTVSLADLKGKVVIVDFWATWCGPCKASLPGMQMAVNKYKDDPNVKFLFVDTWENGDNYNLDGAKKFIADNKYNFTVLLDATGDDGRQSKVVTAFGVKGIPTKFIIDKNGNIRFKYVGYSGTPEKLVDEVTAMVDMAGNPDGDAPKEKTGTEK